MSRLKRHHDVEVPSRRINRVTDSYVDKLTTDFDALEAVNKSILKLKNKKQLSKRIRATKQMLHILQYWNSKCHVHKMKLPVQDRWGTLTSVTKSAEYALGAVKRILAGDFYHGTDPDLKPPTIPVTMAVMKECIDKFNTIIADTSVKPYNKEYIKKLNLARFFYDDYPGAVCKSYFLDILHNGVVYITPSHINKNPDLAKLMLDEYNSRVRDEVRPSDKDYINFIIGANHLREQMDKYPGGIPGWGSEEEIWVEKLYKAIDHKDLRFTPFTLRHKWLYADCLIQYIDYIGYGSAMEKAYKSTDEYKERLRQEIQEERIRMREEEEIKAKMHKYVLPDDSPLKKRLQGHFATLKS